ncbi:MAG: hypothetical protein KBD10_02350 [Candidatus Pacebacteria bacterium]|nr:hypothetical protein [Candidatus Paceibacterota bacterium]
MSVVAKLANASVYSIDVDYLCEIPSEFFPEGFLGFVYTSLNERLYRDTVTHSLENVELHQLVNVHGNSFWAPNLISQKMQEGPGIEYITCPFAIYRKLFLEENYNQMRLLNLRTGIALSRLPVDIFRKYFGNEVVPCWHAVAFTKFQGLNYVIPVVRTRKNQITKKDEVIFRWYRFHRINFRTPVVTLY